MAEIGIGSTIYFWDENRRVYDPKDRRLGSLPIWREHWRPVKIVGETRVSWVTDHDMKVPKRAFADGKCPRDWCRNTEDIDRAEWVEKNRFKIADTIRYVYDYDTLKRVAEAIGWKS